MACTGRKYAAGSANKENINRKIEVAERNKYQEINHGAEYKRFEPVRITAVFYFRFFLRGFVRNFFIVDVEIRKEGANRRTDVEINQDPVKRVLRKLFIKCGCRKIHREYGYCAPKSADKQVAIHAQEKKCG